MNKFKKVLKLITRISISSFALGIEILSIAAATKMILTHHENLFLLFIDCMLVGIVAYLLINDIKVVWKGVNKRSL